MSATANPANNTGLRIQRLFIYPIKSLKPIEVQQVELTNEGLRFDRCFVLVYPPADGEEVAKHLTIKRVYQLALFRPEIDSSWSKLTIKHKSGLEPASISVPLTPSPLNLLNAATYQVSIFGTTAIGVDVGEEAANFFSHHLRTTVRLLYIGGSGRREIPGSAYVRGQLNPLSLALKEGLQLQRVRFADAAPLLVTSTASEEELRSRLPAQHRGEDIILRLRPNIHIDVGSVLPPWDEDTWSTVIAHTGKDGTEKIVIKCIFNCPRCLSLNADPDTGQYICRERQLYGYLAPDRRVNSVFPHKPCFGQYAFAGPAGAIIRVGDKIEITERKQP